MAEFNMREFYEKQVAYYRHNVEFDEHEIAWENEQLKKSRADDRRLVEHIWSKGPRTALDAELFGKDFKSVETKRILANRKRWYRMKKRDLRNLQDYLKRLEAIV